MPNLECLSDLCTATGGTFSAPATLTALSGVQDYSVEPVDDMANASARGSRFKKKQPAMREWKVVGTILKVTGGTAYETLRDAYLNGTTLHLIALDGPKATVGSEGPNADWYVSKFTRAGEIEGLVVYAFELELAFSANEPTWYEVSA